MRRKRRCKLPGIFLGRQANSKKPSAMPGSRSACYGSKPYFAVAAWRTPGFTSRMRVTMTRSGGFAGIRSSTTIDSARLSPEKASELVALVHAAKVFELPAETPSTDKQRDRFQYEIVVEENGRTQSARFGEQAGSAELQSLLRWLGEAARNQR